VALRLQEGEGHATADDQVFVVCHACIPGTGNWNRCRTLRSVLRQPLQSKDVNRYTAVASMRQAMWWL
ncbi:MAG TPA: hypothetical protein PLN78_08965, partial [Pseudomonadales bacterium]|nr:hypothetical protein [Pseudomonadales bacterium]